MARPAAQLFNFGGGSSGSNVATGGNQYFNALPSLPGIVPPATSTYNPATLLSGNKGQAPSANSQYYAGNTLDPAFTKDFFGWLQSNIGKGATPFNLSATLPSTGDTTAPGTLTAPNNPLVMDLMKSFQSGPLADMLKTGSPIDQLPAWKAMIEAQQRNIKQNEANLKEQFNVGGGLVGSPYGAAVTDFESQTAKDQNAMLLQAQTQALEAAKGRQLQSAGLEDNFSQYLQSLDQGSIDRLLQEFIRTRPEYSPLLNSMFGAATTFPPYMQKSQGQGIMGGLAGPLAGAAGAGIATGIGGGSASEIAMAMALGLCWVSEVLYGTDDPRTTILRYWLGCHWAKNSKVGAVFVWLYRRYGKRFALFLSRHTSFQLPVRFVFDRLLDKARQELYYAAI